MYARENRYFITIPPAAPRYRQPHFWHVGRKNGGVRVFDPTYANNYTLANPFRRRIIS